MEVTTASPLKETEINVVDEIRNDHNTTWSTSCNCNFKVETNLKQYCSYFLRFVNYMLLFFHAILIASKEATNTSIPSK